VGNWRQNSPLLAALRAADELLVISRA
jgi:hypothetical protein